MEIVSNRPLLNWNILKNNVIYIPPAVTAADYITDSSVTWNAAFGRVEAKKQRSASTEVIHA